MGAIVSWALGLLSPFFCLLSTGCAPDDLNRTNDPFNGTMPPPRPSSAVGLGQPLAVPVPPLPPQSSTGSPAALTNPRGPLDPTRSELRIGSGAGAGGAITPAWQPSGPPATGVALQAPQPLTGAVPLQPKPPSDLQLTGNATAPTYEQLKAQLKARGVTQVSILIDWTTGKTTLTCFGPETKTGHQRYDVPNATDEVAALQKVLKLLDQPPAH